MDPANTGNNTLVIDNAMIQAFKGLPELNFHGGVVLQSPEQQRFRQIRYGTPCDMFDDCTMPKDFLAGTYAYAGPVTNHFGHYMAEMPHRILHAKKHFNPDKWLFIAQQKSTQTSYHSLPPTVREVVHFFELPLNNIEVVNKNIYVKKLLICEQGSALGSGPKSYYLDALSEYSSWKLNQLFKDNTSHKKVYVSRSNILTGGIFLGEKYLEQLLEQEGFYIFRPEKFPLLQQMNLYRKADKVVFAEGSACHGLELLGREVINSCYFFARRKNSIELFKQTLEPRCHELSHLEATDSVGSFLFDKATGINHLHLDASLFNIELLIDFCRTNNIAQLKTFNKQKYISQASKDLMNYFTFNIKNHRNLCDFKSVPKLIKNYIRIATTL